MAKRKVSGEVRVRTKTESASRRFLATVTEAEAKEHAQSFADPEVRAQIMTWWREEQAKKKG